MMQADEVGKHRSASSVLHCSWEHCWQCCLQPFGRELQLGGEMDIGKLLDVPMFVIVEYVYIYIYSKCVCVYVHINVYIHMFIYIRIHHTYTYTSVVESRLCLSGQGHAFYDREIGYLGICICICIRLYIPYALKMMWITFATTTVPFETTASDGWLAFVMDSNSTRFWWSFFEVKDDSIAGQIAPNLELWLADTLSPFPWTDGLLGSFCSSEWCHLWGVFGAKGKFREFAPKF